MRRSALHAMAAIILLCFGGVAAADSVVESWSCKLDEGKSIEDVKAANSKWLAFVHKTVSDKITSQVATSLVGKSDGFMFVDTFPDVVTWAAAKAALETEEGEAAEASFEGISTCTENRLWNVADSK